MEPKYSLDTITSFVLNLESAPALIYLIFVLFLKFAEGRERRRAVENEEREVAIAASIASDIAVGAKGGEISGD